MSELGRVGRSRRSEAESVSTRWLPVPEEELEDFVEADTDNVIELFEVFNKGTHGLAWRFNLTQLQTIRKRAEDGIMFLSSLVN